MFKVCDGCGWQGKAVMFVGERCWDCVAKGEVAMLTDDDPPPKLRCNSCGKTDDHAAESSSALCQFCFDAAVVARSCERCGRIDKSAKWFGKCEVCTRWVKKAKLAPNDSFFSTE